MGIIAPFQFRRRLISRRMVKRGWAFPVAGQLSSSVITVPATTKEKWRGRLLYSVITLALMVKQMVPAIAIRLQWEERVGLGVSLLFVATLGSVVVASAWVRLLRARWQLAGYLFLNVLITALVFADVLYHREFTDLVSAASLTYMWQLRALGSNVATLLRPVDLLLWIDIPLLVAVAFVHKDRLQAWLPRERARNIVVLTLTGLLMVLPIRYLNPALHPRMNYEGTMRLATRMGFLTYHAIDIKRYIERRARRATITEEELSTVRAWFDRKRAKERDHPPRLFGIARGHNVVMLQLESFQSFVLGLSVDGQEITPNLNRLAREGIAFTNLYNQTGNGRTADGDLLANCSLFPTRVGVVFYEYGSNAYRCMPRLLQEHGYRTAAFYPVHANFWNIGVVYPRMGYQQVYSVKDYVVNEVIGFGISDESFLRQGAEKIKALPEPFYAFTMTMSGHAPFQGIPVKLNLGALEGTLAGDFLHAAHYTDGAVGQFVDSLAQDGLLERTVLVVYGDHPGLSRTASGMAELLQVPPEDAVFWFQVENRLPFIVRLPETAATGEEEKVAGQADIAPTLAGLLGVSTDSVFFMGNDLLAQPKAVVPFYKGSAMDDRYLFLSADADPVYGKCYRTQTSAQTPVGECMGIANQALEELAISRLIVERDMIPALVGSGR